VDHHRRVLQEAQVDHPLIAHLQTQANHLLLLQLLSLLSLWHLLIATWPTLQRSLLKFARLEWKQLKLFLSLLTQLLSMVNLAVVLTSL
jgi:hypothetical protein